MKKASVQMSKPLNENNYQLCAEPIIHMQGIQVADSD